MLSQFERYAFKGELRVYTKRDNFKNSVPTGLELFSKFKNINDSSPYIYEKEGRKLEVAYLNICSNRFVEILFWLTDPSIPDNVLLDRDERMLRTASRKETEDPAVSAHVLIDLNADQDQYRKYPMIIENIDFLPRSLIVNYLNLWFENFLAEERDRPEKKDTKLYCPRVEFIAPGSCTLEEAFDNGSALTGVKWVEDTTEETAFGDDAYTVVKRKDVGLSVKNGATGEAAKALLKSMWDSVAGTRPKRFKVTVVDDHNRSKTVGVDPLRSNVLSNIFISQIHFDNFDPPLALCEEEIRSDFIRKMKVALD